MNNQAIELDSRTLADALGVVGGFETFNLDLFEKTQILNRSFVEALVTEMEDADLLCDHPAGTCACGPLATLEEIRLALQGKKICPECGGDGFVLDNPAAVDEELVYRGCPATVPIS